MATPYEDDIYGTGGRKKPCKACSDFKSWAGFSNINPKTNKGQDISQDGQHECPLDRSELGRNTWSFLHTMAAYFPEKPTIDQQKDMNQFINVFSKFYPCHECANDFREDIKKDPPKTSSRWELSQWFCRMHNVVNNKLGKPEFDCKKVDERWLDGWKDGSCD